jgi:hypothetical protein
MITRRQCPGGWVESRDHANSTISRTNANVNNNAVIAYYHPLFVTRRSTVRIGFSGKDGIRPFNK